MAKRTELGMTRLGTVKISAGCSAIETVSLGFRFTERSFHKSFASILYVHRHSMGKAAEVCRKGTRKCVSVLGGWTATSLDGSCACRDGL